MSRAIGSRKSSLLIMKVEREAGGRVSGTVRRPSMRSAEAEDRRRGRYADDAGSAFRAPAKPANRYGKLHKTLDAAKVSCAAITALCLGLKAV